MRRPLNPFDPSRPIAPTQFVGRGAEIDELIAALNHAQRGRPRHFLITGDRGAGKTSFLDLLRKKATDLSEGFNFIVVDFAIDRHSTRLDLVRAIQADLAKVLAAQAPLKDLLGKVWEFIQRFEAGGVAYRPSEPATENHRDICKNLADSLREVVEKVCIDIGSGDERLGYDGILLLVDETDQASEDLDLGTFFKLLLERLNSNGCHRVVVGLAGLLSTPQVLVKSHPSSLRIFDELPLDDLQEPEVDDLLIDAELKVRNDGFEEFEFTEDAKRLLQDLSGGHAHFVHQFGYCAFEKACQESPDEFLDVGVSHVMSGAFESRGALELIGDVYFQRAFEGVESNEVALAILDRMCETPKVLVSIEDVGAELGMEVDLIRAAVPDLVEIGFLQYVKKEERYRIRHPCFAYWLKAKRPQVA